MIRIGQGFDVHPLVDIEGRKLVLGGVDIAHPRSLEGDSDGDVLTHAVIDAILGAARLGDLGMWFSPETARGARSVDLLAVVREAAQAAGWRVVNVDSTVIAQEPRIRPHASKMEETLARALAVLTDRVSVKATTTDHLGFLGRREGIAALAAVLIESR